MWGIIIFALIVGIVSAIVFYLKDLYFYESECVWAGIVSALVIILFGLIINLIVPGCADKEVIGVTKLTPISMDSYRDGTPKYYYEYEDGWGFAIKSDDSNKLVKIFAQKEVTTILESEKRYVEYYRYDYKNPVLRFFFLNGCDAEYVIYGPSDEVNQTFNDLSF